MLQQNEITELYNQCFAHERKVVKLDIERLKLQFAKAALFGKPWFDPPPVLDEHSAIDKTVDLKIRRQLWEARKYRSVPTELRNCKSTIARRFVLAYWLTEEKVCEPEDILGTKELRRIATSIKLGCAGARSGALMTLLRVWGYHPACDP